MQFIGLTGALRRLELITNFLVEVLWRAPLPPRRQDALPSKHIVKRPPSQTPPPAPQTPPKIRQPTLGGLPIPMTGKTDVGKTFSEIAFGPNDQCDRLDVASHTTNNCPPCRSRSISVRRAKRVVFLGAIAITSGLSILFPQLLTIIPVLAGALINV